MKFLEKFYVDEGMKQDFWREYSHEVEDVLEEWLMIADNLAIEEIKHEIC